MTDEQRQRIHDITYSTEDRMELAERIVRLEDERDKLRSERDLYSGLVEDMDHPDTANQLRAENAKLRELVSDMFEEIEEAGFDPLVEWKGKRGSYYEEDLSWRVKIRERVRELGIEVDNDD